MQGLSKLEKLDEKLKFSSGYLYGLLQLSDMQGNVKNNPENALWHPWFAFRTRRFLERKRGLEDAQRRQWQSQLADIIASRGIEKFADAYKIVLFTYLYQQRD